jgi:hypothetical protein
LVGIGVDTTSTIRWQGFCILRSQIKIDVFGSALAISGRLPSENVISVARYYLGGGNRVGEIGREGVGNKLMIPVMSTLNPKVRDLGGERIGSD